MNAPTCPRCHVKLHLVAPNEPWHDEYLICPKCDGTYNVFEFGDEAEVRAVVYFERLVSRMQSMMTRPLTAVELKRFRAMDPGEFARMVYGLESGEPG